MNVPFIDFPGIETSSKRGFSLHCPNKKCIFWDEKCIFLLYQIFVHLVLGENSFYMKTFEISKDLQPFCIYRCTGCTMGEQVVTNV